MGQGDAVDGGAADLWPYIQLVTYWIHTLRPACETLWTSSIDIAPN